MNAASPITVDLNMTRCRGCDKRGGTVFKLTGGTFTALHRFTGGEDGEFSLAGLKRSASSTLYDAINSGGSGGGAVWKAWPEFQN